MVVSGSSSNINATPAWAEALVAAAGNAGIGVAVSTKSPDAATQHWVFASPVAIDLIGTTSAELLGRPVEPSFIGNAYFSAEAPADHHSGPHVRRLKGELIRRDAKRIPIHWITVESESQQDLLFVHWLIRTDRQYRAERALMDSELRFRRLIDAAPDGVLVLVDGRVVYANQAITRLRGCTHSRQLAQLQLGDLIAADDRDVADSAIAAVKLGEKLTSPLELRISQRGGRSLPVEALLVSTEWDAEKAILLIARDVSGRRQVQSQSIKTDRLAAVGTLAAGVAHEINNPLAYVLLNLQYLIREIPKLGTSDDRIGQLLERLREARHGAERVSAIVRDLRTFSRTDEESVGSVELRRVLQSAIKVARSQLMDRGQIIEILDDVPAVRGNASRLEQVFLNLLINAIQALSSTSPASNSIRIRVSRSGEHVVVEISDTGVGIAPEHLDRVFDPFFTTKPVGLGTGLGLPICHSIITKMGGAISVSSEVGRGSTFEIRLPIDREVRVPTPRTPTPPPARVSERARVLVVDDELTVVSMLSRILTEEHIVEVATSAETALELLDRGDFDVVLCDLLMPNMSGVDLYEEVSRRYPGFQERIVFMTGGAFTPRAAQFLSRVNNPRIEKPFDMKSLRRLVRDMAIQRHSKLVRPT
jgi:PAS domain S-box-containing protein